MLTLVLSYHVSLEKLSSCDQQRRENLPMGLPKDASMLDNAALFQVKGPSVAVLIMTQGGAFLLAELFYLNVCLT